MDNPKPTGSAAEVPSIIALVGEDLVTGVYDAVIFAAGSHSCVSVFLYPALSIN